MKHKARARDAAQCERVVARANETTRGSVAQSGRKGTRARERERVSEWDGERKYAKRVSDLWRCEWRGRTRILQDNADITRLFYVHIFSLFHSVPSRGESRQGGGERRGGVTVGGPAHRTGLGSASALCVCVCVSVYI